MTDNLKNEALKYNVLQEELEIRYGVAMAQEIIDQIKKADDVNNQTDYMAVKATSEVLDLFRTETKQKIKDLKNAKAIKLPANIANLKEKRTQLELEKIFNCYWLSQQAFYKLYNKAMEIYEVPSTYRYDRYNQPTEMKAVA